MKRILQLFVGLSLMLGFTSCESDIIESADFNFTENATSVEEKLTLAQLPVTIQTYLREKYVGFTFKEAKKVTGDNAATSYFYVVSILYKDAVVELKFNPNGVLITNSTETKKVTGIKETELLPAIKEYIKSNFANFTFESAEKVAIGTVVTYNVKIKNTTAQLLLTFNGDGKLLNRTVLGGELKEIIKESDLIAAIKEYIKKTYPNAVFVSGEKITKNTVVSFVIKLKTDAQNLTLKFDGNGKIVSILAENLNKTELTESDLPDAIKTYLSKMGTYTFVNARRLGLGTAQYYLVIVKVNGKALELKFDGNGALMVLPSLPEKPFTVDSLLAETKTYLSSNFPGYTFKSAKRLTSNGTVYYLVSIVYQSKVVELKFDNKGILIQAFGSSFSEVKIEQSALPKAATDYLLANYKNYVFVFAKKVTKTSGITYIVKIKSSEKVYELTFDKNGKFISVKKS